MKRLVLFVSLVAAPILAQQAVFEVATIRRSTDQSPPISIRRASDQLLTTNTSVAFLIRWAYDLDHDQLVGSNREMETITYDVSAKFPEGTSSGQSKIMMQGLLAERFNLKIHRDTKELPSYALVVDRAGVKVRFLDTLGPTPQDPFKMTERGRMTGTQVNPEMLAKVLASELSRPVKNETDLSRFFNFTLDWTPDLDADVDEAQASRPSIFTAIREQLGFRLEPRRSKVPVVVIDGVQSAPSGN